MVEDVLELADGRGGSPGAGGGVPDKIVVEIKQNSAVGNTRASTLMAR